MGLSYRHNPICGITTARTEKWWKQFMSRKLRHLLKGTDLNPTHKYTMARNQYGPKDGKRFFDPIEEWKLFRK